MTRKARIAQAQKGQEYNRRTSQHQRHVEELRQGSTAQPHRNRARYHRASEKRGALKDF